MRMRVERDPAAKSYSDLAITPVVDAQEETLELFDLNEGSRAAVDKARRQAKRHSESARAAAEATPV